MSNKCSDNCLNLSYCKILINVQILLFVAFAKQHMFSLSGTFQKKKESRISKILVLG